jgi:carboxypeptidase family protein
MTVRLCSFAWLLTMIAAVPAAMAQPAPSVIRGRVVADGNDRPLRRALVALTGPDRGRPVLTDDEGRFEIQPPDASASLTVTKAGYATTKVTPPRATRDGREVVVRMSRGGVISGRVIDTKGETAIGAKVTARMSDTAGDSTIFEAETDDLGEYRISGLPAGRYVVAPALAGTRVLTEADYVRLLEQMKQGRRAQDILLDPTGATGVADVRPGDETGNVDFEVKASGTIRALAPVKRELQVTAPGTQATTTAPQSQPTTINIGPPQTALGGGRVVTVSFSGGARSLDLALTGGAAVSGTVVDSAGEPFQGITVSALQVRYEGGRAVARAFGWTRVTDDRGRYRLFGLVPGSYLIVASLEAVEFSPKDSATGFAPLYYPSTPHIEAAQMLRLASGSDLSGTDLTFATSSVVRVAGKALDFMGQPLVGRVLLGVSQRSANITTDSRVVKTEKEGSFEFTDVPPGDYVVQAIAEAGFGGPAEFGSEYVTVTDRDPPPVVVPTSRGATLEGHFIVEGAQDPPMRAFSLHATPLDLDRSPVGGRGPSGLAIHDNRLFYLTGLHGVMRLSVPSTLPGWYLKSITIGGVDVTDRSYDFGFAEATLSDAEIVLSTSAARIAGSIERLPNGDVAGATVIAFSTNRDLWFDGSRHIKQTSSAPNHSFEVTGLPAGEYFVAAVDVLSPLDVQSPETLESLVSRAARVTVREGAVSEVTLSLIRR